MPYFNPLAEHAATDPEDFALIARVQAGSRQALETLLERHQPWIYNILVTQGFIASAARSTAGARATHRDTSRSTHPRLTYFDPPTGEAD
jgi:hypothetical protein